LELSADPPFIETKTWRIESLRAGSTLHITDRDIKLHGGFLAGLTETVTGEVTLRVMSGDEELAATAFPVAILAKNQWGGYGSMPELLPAFCMPNDPAVDRVLKGASDVLRRAGAMQTAPRSRSSIRTSWNNWISTSLEHENPGGANCLGEQEVRVYRRISGQRAALLAILRRILPRILRKLLPQLRRPDPFPRFRGTAT